MKSLLRFPIISKSRGLMAVLLVCTVVLAACAPAAAPTSPPAVDTAVPAATTAVPLETTAPVETEAPAATTEPAAEATEDIATPAGTGLTEATINVVDDPNFGEILVDGDGMTLYIFTKDEPNKSNCEGECLEKWPPLLTQGNPTLGEGVDPALVGSAEMPDGSMIVTYNEMPLYYWYEDFKPGDVAGQAVGDVWWVINPAGEVIEDAPPGEETAPADATPAETQDAAAAGEATINVANDPNFGEILVDGQGMTLYIFTRDVPDKSNCEGECLEKWPPLLTQGSPTLGEGVDPALVGSAEMPDGSLIVTYNHMPLYYWYEDAQPGDVAGQGVGEVWWVIAPDGTVIDE